ncbi:hypothetical protein B5S33_g4643 [[Candida] boidinii]|nr:hypothetical protein B5S33_g4643 [[Candida] boidinii]
MSLKGVRKVIYRTPHQILGKKSTDDEIIKIWEHDIKVAMAGLDFLEHQERKWSQTWGRIMDNMLQTLRTFKIFHKNFQVDTESDDKDKKPQQVDDEFSNITVHEIKQAEKLIKSLYNSLSEIIDKSEESFCEKCHSMKGYLHETQKLITKRNHKKIDYDMTTTTVEKNLSKDNLDKSDKLKMKLETSKQQLNEYKVIFLNIDEKTKLIVPQVLATLSEFLNKLSIKLYYDQLEIFETVTKSMKRFVESQGLVMKTLNYTYEDVINDWHDQFSLSQTKLKDLEFFEDYRPLQDKTFLQKSASQVRKVSLNLVGTTFDATQAIVSKTVKPSQNLNIRHMKIENPVRPYSREGLFITSNDPLDVLKMEEKYFKMSADMTAEPHAVFREPKPHVENRDINSRTETWETSEEKRHDQETDGILEKKSTVDGDVNDENPAAGSADEDIKSYIASETKPDENDIPRSGEEEKQTSWMKPLSLSASRTESESINADDALTVRHLSISSAAKYQDEKLFDNVDLNNDKGSVKISSAPDEPFQASSTPATSQPTTPRTPKSSKFSFGPALSPRVYGRMTGDMTETEKFVSVSTQQIRSIIYKVDSTPVLDHAPISISFRDTYKDISEWKDSISSKSSITANLFRQKC